MKWTLEVPCEPAWGYTIVGYSNVTSGIIISTKFYSTVLHIMANYYIYMCMQCNWIFKTTTIGSYFLTNSAQNLALISSNAISGISSKPNQWPCCSWHSLEQCIMFAKLQNHFPISDTLEQCSVDIIQHAFYGQSLHTICRVFTFSWLIHVKKSKIIVSRTTYIINKYF